MTVTTLAGIQLEDRVVLAADSQITEDNLRTISTSTPKIIHVGKYILGITGDTRPGDILAYNWTPPTYKGANPIQWMGKKVLPSIITAFKENGYDPYEATKEKDAGFDYLYRLMATSSILRRTSHLSRRTPLFMDLVVVGSLLLVIFMTALAVSLWGM